MKRINACFNQLKAKQQAALIPFITAGDPSPQLTVTLMHTLVDSGADIIELGMPFSDPMADGPVIQRASERALAAGTTLHDVLHIVKTFRETNSNTPVVLMGYVNPVENMGYAVFAKAANEVGVDGVLLVDLPPEEIGELGDLFRQHKLDPIFLLSPTTTNERIARISEVASGYLYYVSLKGVTGSAKLDAGAVTEKLRAIRAVTDLPIGVGFGIRDAESAAQIAQISDAVIVGSALLQQIEQANPDQVIAVVATWFSELHRAVVAVAKKAAG